MIKVENLSLDYGNTKVLDNVSLNVPKQSIYGFLGPNGAGKALPLNVLWD